MTRAQAVTEFAIVHLPSILATYGGKDITAMRTAWNDYIDDLEKSGVITNRQASTWNQPDFERLIRQN